jgi:hypothetical protein
MRNPVAPGPQQSCPCIFLPLPRSSKPFLQLQAYTVQIFQIKGFYFNQVVSKHDKIILACTENKLKEYKSVRRMRQEYFAVYREYADVHKTEAISTIF